MLVQRKHAHDQVLRSKLEESDFGIVRLLAMIKPSKFFVDLAAPKCTARAVLEPTGSSPDFVSIQRSATFNNYCTSKCNVRGHDHAEELWRGIQSLPV